MFFTNTVIANAFPSPICIIKNHYNHIPITNPVPTVGYYGYTQGHSHMLVTTS